MYDIVCSIVLYKNERKQLLAAIDSFLSTDLHVKLLLIDNSPDDNLKNLKIEKRVEYFHNLSNLGYGSAHNLGIKKYLNKSKYYLVLNPDIFFNKGVLEGIISFMNTDDSIGLVMPKVLYPDGSLQYLAKLIPSPLIFLLRRFIPFSNHKNLFSNKFELRFSEYNIIMEAPYLSGCFMFFRNRVLKEINGFDENIFMHMEDLDISRRCNEAGYKTIFYPHQIVYHDHIFKSFFTLLNLKMYFTSAFYYFNKWGWIFDKKRYEINNRVIEQIIKAKASSEKK